jgi:hypothetical protein
MTIHDLLNLARMGKDDDPQSVLERIYEWYFSRTMNAIRVAYGAATALAAAIYGLVAKGFDPADRDLLSCGLAVAAIVCVAAGIFQRRELAQLHREFAAAARLLAELRAMPRRLLRRGEPPVNRPGSAWLGLAWVAALALLVAGFACGVHEWGTPTFALAAVIVVTTLLAAAHMVAELRQPKTPSMGTGDTMDDKIGHVRLDAYVLSPAATKMVNRLIPKDLSPG